MFQNATALFLYAETSLHLGSGTSLGAIDLAIQRERYTGFPVGAAQGIKGPVRDWFERTYDVPKDPKPDELNEEQKCVLAAFGPNTNKASEHAGAVAFTDARILLFPVRSMKGVFAWITCPFALGRLRRDLGLAKIAETLDWVVPTVEKNDDKSYALGATPTHACKTDQDKVLLEEEVFTYQPDQQGDAESNMQKLAAWLLDHAFPQPPPSEGETEDEYAFWRNRIASHLLVLHDDDFRHFVKTATEVQARVKLNDQKTVEDGGLFYQENLPPETLLYSVVLAARSMRSSVAKEADAILTFTKQIGGERLQIGGGETTGKGYVYASFLRNSETNDNGSSEPENQTPENQTQEATP